jgi:hypothetical protein
VKADAQIRGEDINALNKISHNVWYWRSGIVRNRSCCNLTSIVLLNTSCKSDK